MERVADFLMKVATDSSDPSSMAHERCTRKWILRRIWMTGNTRQCRELISANGVLQTSRHPLPWQTARTFFCPPAQYPIDLHAFICAPLGGGAPNFAYPPREEADPLRMFQFLFKSKTCHVASLNLVSVQNAQSPITFFRYQQCVQQVEHVKHHESF